MVHLVYQPRYLIGVSLIVNQSILIKKIITLKIINIYSQNKNSNTLTTTTTTTKSTTITTTTPNNNNNLLYYYQKAFC